MGFAGLNPTSFSSHPRYLTDVNGDGKADVVGFGGDGLWVALSTGTSFGQTKLWVTGYRYYSGWSDPNYVRTMADVNGDGKADVVGFSNDGVHVSRVGWVERAKPSNKGQQKGGWGGQTPPSPPPLPLFPF